MRNGMKIIRSVFKKISPEIEAAESLSELQEVLKKNDLEVLMNLLTCSDDESCMHLAGCVSRKNPFDVRTSIYYFLDDDWDGEEFSLHLIDVPLLAKEELEAWEKSYVKRLKQRLLSLGKD